MAALSSMALNELPDCDQRTLALRALEHLDSSAAASVAQRLRGLSGIAEPKGPPAGKVSTRSPVTQGDPSKWWIFGPLIALAILWPAYSVYRFNHPKPSAPAVGGAGIETLATTNPPTGPSGPPSSAPQYEVIEESRLPGIKLSLRVQLPGKVTEDQLRSIAQEIRSTYPGEFERIFITYHLAGMPLEEAAWATTHFNPTLEVKILGPTAEQEHELQNAPQQADKAVLERWFDQSAFVGGSVRLVERGGTLFMERRFTDGSILTEELRESHDAGVRRLDKVEDHRGEYFTISKDGSLNIYTSDGLLKTLPPSR